MKKILLSVIILSISISSCKRLIPHEDVDDPIETAECIKTRDMMRYYDDTEEMLAEGRKNTAVRRFVWFHENALKYDTYGSELPGVRLSFALSDWVKFAKNYKPAMKALTDIRDRDTKKTLKTGDTLLFKDVCAINRHLEESDKTIKLFTTLIKQKPNASKECWKYAKRYLFDAKRYDIIKNYISDPNTEFNEKKAHLDRAMIKGDEDLNDFLKESFAKECAQLIDFYLAVNDLKSAKIIQVKALKVINDDLLIDAIPTQKS